MCPRPPSQAKPGCCPGWEVKGLGYEKLPAQPAEGGTNFWAPPAMQGLSRVSGSLVSILTSA